MPAEDERGLHRAVLAGDEPAWQVLYEASFAELDAFVLWRCAGLRDLADEVLQETWLIAVRRIAAFDPARGTFLAWLRGIAGNVVHNQLRRRASVCLIGDDHPAPADPGIERREQAEQIARALTRLPERYEVVLRAKYLDGRSVERIATESGQTTKTVESLLSRARQAFRAAYVEHEGPLLHETEP